MNYQLPKHSRYSLKLCLNHRKANAYGMPLDFITKCPCCSKFSNKETLSVNFQPFKIYYVGPQLPSFLNFIKVFAILFALLCIIYVLPLQIIYKDGQACETIIDCSSSFFLTISVFNTFDNVSRLNAMSYTSIAVFVTFILVLLSLRKSINGIKAEIDGADMFPSPYSALCQLPEDYGDQEIIQREVEQWWRTQIKRYGEEVKRQCSQLFTKNNQKQTDIADRWNKNNSNLLIKNQYYNTISNIIFYHKHKVPHELAQQKYKNVPKQGGKQLQLQKYQRKITQQTQLQQAIQTMRDFCQNKYCLIIFKHTSYAKYFYRKTNCSIIQYIFSSQQYSPFAIGKKQANILIDNYPADINWQNHRQNQYQFIKHTLPSYFFLILSLAVNTAIFYGITYSLNKCILDQDQIPFISNYFYILSSFLINGITFIFNKVLCYFSTQEKHSTYSSKKQALIIKILLHNITAMFLIPFLTFRIMNNTKLWVSNGFFQSLNMTVILYMVVYLFERYITPSAILSYYAYFSMNQTQDLSQTQANERYIKPKLRIDEAYASILTVIFLSLCTMPYNPCILVLSALWFFIQFWLQKCNIAYVYGQDQFHGTALAFAILKICQYFFIPLIFSMLTVFCVGGLFFSPQPPVTTTVINSFLLILGICFIFCPTEKLSQKLFSCKSYGKQIIGESKEYETLKDKFLIKFQDYQRASLWGLKDRSEHYKRQSTQNNDRLKCEMNIMQKNLSISLKQQMLNNKGAILQKTRQGQQIAEQNELYFEYERKVDMKKVEPKVAIPSLFSKSPHLFNHSNKVKKIEKHKSQLREQDKFERKTPLIDTNPKIAKAKP